MVQPFPKGTGGFINPEQIVENLKIVRGMKIADFGCGAGYFVVSLAEKVGEIGIVSAVDVLGTALESTRSKVRAKGLFNVKTIRGDLEKEKGSGLDDASQDAVLIANTLHQSPQQTEIIKEAERVLKDNGFLLIIDWFKNSPFGPSYEARISKEVARDLVESQNFKLVVEFNAGNYHYGLKFQKV